MRSAGRYVYIEREENVASQSILFLFLSWIALDWMNGWVDRTSTDTDIRRLRDGSKQQFREMLAIQWLFSIFGKGSAPPPWIYGT